MMPGRKRSTRTLRGTALSGLVVLLGLGCQTLQLTGHTVSLPDQHHLVVESFWISSSFPLSNSDPLIRELIELKSDVESVLRVGGLKRQIEIYIFDDRARYDRFIQANYPGLPRRRAYFIAQDQRETIFAFRDERLIEDLRHEACHALLHASIGPIPLWLDEGLAEYFETPGAADGLHSRHIRELQAALQHGWRPSLTRLERLTQLSHMTASDYREAWAWVYWLLHECPDGRPLFLGYLYDIKSGTREPLSHRVFSISPRPDVSLSAMVSRLQDAQPAGAAATIDRLELDP